MNISQVSAHEILDSNGNPTVEVEVVLEDGARALGQVPAGASTGSHEAHELRDGDPQRFGGKGVLKAVANVNTIIRDKLVGQDAYNIYQIDELLREADGTENKSHLGGNAMVGTSMAVCKAAAQSLGLELYQHISNIAYNNTLAMPQPMILLMEGGKHGAWATDIQEFMVMPQAAYFPTLRDQLYAGAHIFHALGKILAKKGFDTGVGFEGAYCPRQLRSNEEAIELILEAATECGFTPGKEITLALDAAASEFYQDGNYVLHSERDAVVSPQEWLERMTSWVNQYPIQSLEDGFHESSWADWQTLMSQVGDHCQIVGDDLVTTNPKLIRQAIDKKAMNATLIKLNQIGTVTETLEAIHLSHQAGFTNIISHRGGETNDDFIADLAVGTVATQCKFGGPDRGERLAKYNRLLRVENQLSM
jgi:enolase